MTKLVPLILALLGLAGGVGAGLAMRPVPEPEQAATEVDDDAEKHAAPSDARDMAGKNYVKLNNQFIVPVIGDRRVSALVALSISVETPPGQSQTIYEIEPRLRDSFLQVLFDHANTGGFDGAFTDSNNMAILRRSLLEVAQVQSDGMITDILITDIARQDN